MLQNFVFDIIANSRLKSQLKKKSDRKYRKTYTVNQLQASGFFIFTNIKSSDVDKWHKIGLLAHNPRLHQDSNTYFCNVKGLNKKKYQKKSAKN